MLAPIDLVSAHPWRSVTFTTYALSLSFYEAVVLEALVRGEGRNSLILADVEGVRAALGEQGARRVGKDYDVEPIAVVGGGVFHPKVSVFTADDECHVLVGSGNVTFGGWGGNLEAIEHLHARFAAVAIEDTAHFFEQLAMTDRVRHGAHARCAAVADALRTSTRGQPHNGDIRLLHNLDGAISEKLALIVDDLGGATRLVVAAPFWDDGSAIDTLCTRIGLSEVFVHAHGGGTVEGSAGSNWPAHAASTVHPVQLAVMDEEEPRRLHAKLFEVNCKRGRVVLSGSANATAAALIGSRNVEACVARVQREPRRGWRFVAAEAPELKKAQDEKKEDDQEIVGVLRAVLEGEWVTGQVVAPVMTGTVSVLQLTAVGAEELGEAALGAGATFNIRAPQLELKSWKGERLILQVRNAGGRRAEGFVSVAAFAEISRRAGPLAPRLLAILAGTETPADVAAIMTWFHEDPRRLANTVPGPISGGGDEREAADDERTRTIPVVELNVHFGSPSRSTGDGPGTTGWRRFMESVFAAFRERRGPFGQTGDGRKGDDDDDDDRDRDPEPKPVDPAVPRSLEVFGKLFNLMLSAENASRHALMAYDLAQYVCERLQPDFHAAYAWLERSVEALDEPSLPSERRAEVAAAIVVLLASGEKPDGTRRARARLLRLGYPLSGERPPMESVQGFQSVLPQKKAYAELWNELGAVRTFQEQTRAYLSALESGQTSSEYSELSSAAPEEWPVLRDALTSTSVRSRLLVLDTFSNACPKCHITLPGIDRYNLRTVGVATARNCCHRVLLYAGE